MEQNTNQSSRPKTGKTICLGDGGLASEIRQLMVQFKDQSSVLLVFAGLRSNDFNELDAADDSWKASFRSALNSREDYLLVTVGNPNLRRRIAQSVELEFDNVPWGSLVLDDSVVQGSLPSRGSVYLCPRFISQEASIGEFVLLNQGAFVGHGVSIGEFTTVGPYAFIGGDCEIGSDVEIGPGAIISRGVKVGPRSKIGPGSVVIKDVPEGSLVFQPAARAIPAISDKI